MKILLLAEPYMNLHLPIIKELEAEGHTVVHIMDRQLDYGWHNPWRGKRDRLFRRVKCLLSRSYQRYWKRLLKNDDRLQNKFDLLFVINGCSFHPILLEKLRKENHDIETRLYLWDNSQFYDYYYNAGYFDKVLTYDIDDARKYGVELLPFYWPKDIHNSSEVKFRFSIIGSNHDGRLDICRKIVNACNKNNHLPDFIKIVDETLPESEYVCHNRFSIHEVNEVMSQSQIVIDTDRSTQTGTTPRLIWALAMGKKVITTNSNVKRMPFYNPQQILVVDRHNPSIDEDFLNSSDYEKEIVDDLRIDRWVKAIIE